MKVPSQKNYTPVTIAPPSRFPPPPDCRSFMKALPHKLPKTNTPPVENGKSRIEKENEE